MTTTACETQPLPEPDAIQHQTVLERLRALLPQLAPSLAPEASIACLGLDSLDTVQLFCVIGEEFGVRLSVDEFQAATTVSDLLAIVAAKANNNPNNLPK